MKKVIIMFALAMGIITANAQENVTVGENNGSEPTNEARAETSSLDYLHAAIEILGILYVSIICFPPFFNLCLYYNPIFSYCQYSDLIF